MNIINRLKLYKNVCEEHKYGDCPRCPYVGQNDTCMIKEVVWKLHDAPCNWDMQEILKLIKEKW